MYSKHMFKVCSASFSHAWPFPSALTLKLTHLLFGQASTVYAAYGKRQQQQQPGAADG